MARPGLTNNSKFKRVCDELKIGRPLLIGLLEMLWSSRWETGDPIIGDEKDVELACEWEGEPGALFKALLTAGGAARLGFIEEVPDRPGVYQVHHFYENAPDYVAKRREREIDRINKGKTLSDVRREAANKRWEKDKTPDASDSSLDNKPMQADASDFRLHASGMQTDANVPPPAPAPAPAPSNTNTPPNPRKRGKVSVIDLEIPFGLQNPDFIRAWREWIEYCGSKMKPLTAKKQLADFEKIGLTRAIAKIDHTIAMGWTGLREPDDRSVKNHADNKSAETMLTEDFILTPGRKRESEVANVG